MKQDAIEVRGKVLEAQKNAMFRVLLEGMSDSILCHVSGKIRKNQIKILPGDFVMVEMSPYDMTKGRIVYRELNR